MLRKQGHVLFATAHLCVTGTPTPGILPAGHVKITSNHRVLAPWATGGARHRGRATKKRAVCPRARVGFRMDIWLVDESTGQPSNDRSDEHDALAWVNSGRAPGWQLADARLPSLIEASLS